MVAARLARPTTEATPPRLARALGMGDAPGMSCLRKAIALARLAPCGPLLVAPLLVALLLGARPVGAVEEDTGPATVRKVGRPDEQTPDEQTPDEQTPDEQTPDAAPSNAEAGTSAATWLPEAYGRYVTVPDFVTGSLFSVHPSMHAWSTGAGVRWRWRDAAEWRFSVDWLQMRYDDGNWLEDSLPPASAVFLEWDLGFLSAAATHLWRFDLVGDRLQLVVGVGVAVGVFLGDVHATDVVPACAEPASDCVAWRSVTRRALELPTRVLALPIVTTGLDWHLFGELTLRLEGGLYGIPYVGGALAYGAW